MDYAERQLGPHKLMVWIWPDLSAHIAYGEYRGHLNSIGVKRVAADLLDLYEGYYNAGTFPPV